MSISSTDFSRKSHSCLSFVYISYMQNERGYPACRLYRSKAESEKDTTGNCSKWSLLLLFLGGPHLFIERGNFHLGRKSSVSHSRSAYIVTSAFFIFCLSKDFLIFFFVTTRVCLAWVIWNNGAGIQRQDFHVGWLLMLSWICSRIDSKISLIGESMACWNAQQPCDQKIPFLHGVKYVVRWGKIQSMMQYTWRMSGSWVERQSMWGRICVKCMGGKGFVCREVHEKAVR